MPVRKQLKSSQPQAFGKNALLQKQYERLYNRLEKERKSTQRRIQVTEEKCVHAIYYLLQEAESFEQQKKRKEEEEKEKRIQKEGKLPVFYYEIENEYEPPKPETKVTRGRPMTASVRTRKGSADPKGLRNRPSSASPALCTDKADSVPSAPDIQRVPSADRSKRRCSITSSCGSNQKENDSRPCSANVEPPNTTSGSNLKLWQLSLRKNSERKPSAVRRESVSKLAEEVPAASPEPESLNAFARPKTADRYRQRRPDDELSEYWNRRVASIIRKWDLQDNDQYSKDLKVIKDIGRPPYRRVDSKTGEAELRTKTFIQKYSGKYRSLLRPETAPVLENRQRRKEKISRQELATINADTAKHKKNTKMLLLKSREIKLYVENLPGVDKTQNPLNLSNP
ncbi:uncharacterized protein LOC133201299 [Saccostrea echinata]|uniref:uncharacterized protein LOC133201299 n=1 Tax=Saccostrea echinata TaxID=191078 RepID=UPI002A7F76C8|nr:uncharacterized protein LOC133201299 [Saccostrea echinata]